MLGYLESEGHDGDALRVVARKLLHTTVIQKETNKEALATHHSHIQTTHRQKQTVN